MTSTQYSAPDFKRRQLLFDSFSKLQQKSLTESGQSSTSLASNNNNNLFSTTSNNLVKSSSSSSIYYSYKSSGTNKASFQTEEEGAKGTLLYSWGAGYHGQLGLNTARKKCRLVPTRVEFDQPVQQVACGGFHSSILTDDGKVYTWGDGRGTSN